MRLLLYTGKGGVGKTTTAAATAALAASRGMRTLVVSADAAHSLGDVLGESLASNPKCVAPRLDALEVDARAVVEQHWGQVRTYLVDLFRHQGIEEVIAEELALLPGAEELSTLVCVEDWARQDRYDLIVVDCAPTGSALRLVTLPEVADQSLRWLLRLQRATAAIAEPIARSLVGTPLPSAAVFAEADELLYKTLDRLRALLLSQETSLRLVVTPESMVIDEARRALTDLSLFQLGCDAVVMNRVLPEAALNESFFEPWREVQAERLKEVRAYFDPMACLVAPLQSDEVHGVEALSAHGAALFGERDPAALLGESTRLRFESDPQGARLFWPLPGIEAANLDVARIDNEIVVGVSGRRRKLALPAAFSALEVESVSVKEEALVVAFHRSSLDTAETSETIDSVGAVPG